MTSATDKLRRLLDERGVEWKEEIDGVGLVFTEYETAYFGTVNAMENDNEYLYFFELNGAFLTPEQAIAATLGSGTLTAEQVSKATYSHSIHADCADADWQAIADELNAELGSGTCKVEVRESAWGGYTRHCGNCGADLDCDTRNKQNYCPNCGKRISHEE